MGCAWAGELNQLMDRAWVDGQMDIPGHGSTHQGVWPPTHKWLGAGGWWMNGCGAVLCGGGRALPAPDRGVFVPIVTTSSSSSSLSPRTPLRLPAQSWIPQSQGCEGSRWHPGVGTPWGGTEGLQGSG